MTDRRPGPARADDAPPPPYSETDIYSNSGDSGHERTPTLTRPDDAASRVSSATTSEVILTPPSSPGATSYFESRPAPTPRTTTNHDTIVHHITVGPRTLPDDLPWIGALEARDVSEQDWATFRNYLLPDHTARENEEVASRKLQEEAQSNASESGIAQAQLAQIQAHSSRLNPDQIRDHATQTVREWNASFFGPRGITIQLEDHRAPQADTLPSNGGPQAMPGGWDAEFDDQQPREPGTSSSQSGWKRHFGGVKVSNDALKIGDTFIADGNGMKIGSLVMDSNGIRMDGGQPRPWQGSCFPQGGHHSGSFAMGGNRGRMDERNWPQRGRSPSVSSTSSSSTSSSVSSIGSLPDYDDVRDEQLPMYASRLSEWINNPNQIRTKQDVQGVRAELRAMKRSDTDPNIDKQALRRQVKDLRKQWRDVRKQQRRTVRQQKRERRQVKRDRKQQRRAEHRERKQHRGEMRQARRDIKRDTRRGGCGNHPAAPCVPRMGFPPMPQPPAMPHPPAMPAQPAMPFMHHGREARAPGWGGLFGEIRNRGIFGPQGSFGPQQSWPPGPIGGAMFPARQPPPLFPSRSGGQESGVMPSQPQPPPGSWPDEKKEPLPEPLGEIEHEQAQNPVIAQLESQLNQKLQDIQDVKDETQRRALGKEIEALTDSLDRVRIAADEAYAKELASRQ